jgi:hypothetical protein
VHGVGGGGIGQVDAHGEIREAGPWRGR